MCWVQHYYLYFYATDPKPTARRDLAGSRVGVDETPNFDIDGATDDFKDLAILWGFQMQSDRERASSPMALSVSTGVLRSLQRKSTLWDRLDRS